MRDGDVVALEVVVDVHLPVAIDHIVATLDETQSCKLKASRLFRNLAQKSGKRLGGEVEVDEDELFPGFAAKRDHAHRGAIEKFDAFDVGRADEPAVQSVCPAVIGAAKNIFRAAAKGNRSRPVTADIAECSQRALLIPDDDDGFAGDVGGEKSLRVGDR